ncbi:phage tail spike protein [Rummeliibacillus stabekisii]|uniref:phage tail spike protein n=1 Tax=Rummeliibacillus stabekisii TaxID=241244 RepID=UPI00370FBD96
MKNMYIMNTDKETVGILSNEVPFSLPFLEDIMERSLDDFTYTLNFKAPANQQGSEHLVAGNYILYPSMDDDEYLLFKIVEAKENVENDRRYYKSIYAEIAAQDDLLKDIVRPTNFVQQDLETVVKYILTGSNWKVGNIGDFGYQDVNFDEYPTKLQALVDVAKQYGAEMDFRFITKGSKVVSQKIDMLDHLGEQTGKPFIIERDITDIERVENRENLITALIPIGKGEGETQFSLMDGAVSGIPKGYSVEGDTIYSDEAIENYTDDSAPIIAVYKDSEAKNVQELFNNGLKKLQENDRPLMSYKVGVRLLERLAGFEHEEVRFGDTVLVQDKKMIPELYLRARVRKLGRSLSNPDADYVELGDYIPIIPSTNAVVENLQKKINKKENTWDKASQVPAISKDVEVIKVDVGNAKDFADTAITNSDNALKKVEDVEKEVIELNDSLEEIEKKADTALESANGKSTNYYQSMQPESPELYDTWFVLDELDGSVIDMVVWDGTQWLPVINVENMQADINAAKDTANTAYSNVETALTKAEDAFKQTEALSQVVDGYSGDISSIKQTSEGLQTTVEGKADKSQITQLQNAIALKVSQDDYAASISALSTSINARVSKGDLINQINISTEGILIDGKKIHITGNTYIDSGVIGNAQIANGAITNAKISSLDAGKITTGTLSAISITGVNITGSSIYTASSDGRNQVSMTNGEINVTEYGAATGTTQTMKLSGNSGLQLDTTADPYSHLRLDVYESESSAYSAVYKLYAEGYASARAFPELRVISDGNLLLKSSRGSTRVYGDAETTLETSLASVKVQGSTININASDFNYNGSDIATSGGVYEGTGLEVPSSSGGTHLYVRPKSTGSLRVTSTGSTTDYRPVEALAYRSPDSSSNTLIATGGKVCAVSYGSTSAGNWQIMKAASFESTSSYTLKQDITEMNRPVLDVIDELKVYEYRFKSDVVGGNEDNWQVGLISEYSPQVASQDMLAINTYKMTSYLWKGEQELYSMVKGNTVAIEMMTQELQEKDTKIISLEARIEALEAKLA